MYSFNRLTISGYRHEPVPNTFHQQQQESRHIALIFAGRGINCQHPTLYYPMKELLLRGADVLLVDYCLRPNFWNYSDEETKACVVEDTLAAYHSIFQLRSYEQVTLIGKSLGTRAMAELLQAVPTLPQVQAIWVTPLLKIPEIRTQIYQTHPRSLFIIGTEDPHYDAYELKVFEKVTKGASIVIQGGEHLLEVPDGTLASLQAMEQIMQGVQAFLDGKI